MTVTTKGERMEGEGEKRFEGGRVLRSTVI
jgi:hypothetical protein